MARFRARASAADRAVRFARVCVLAATAALATGCDCHCAGPSANAARTTAAQPAPVPLFTCRNTHGKRLRAASSRPAVPSTDNAAEVAATALAADLVAARAARDEWQGRTFEEYIQTLRRECGPGGKFLVDGDVAIADVKLLREFFEDRIQGAHPDSGVVPPVVWPTQQQRALIYCVSDAFGGQHDKVVADMEAATGAWEQVANVHFDHDVAQDAACNAGNDAVVFDVNPVDVGADYLARAFSPGEPRADRNIYVDVAALALDPAQELQLAGLLRHELGHALGLRHDHARPASGACFDDAAGEFSVMGYPRCDGGTRWKLLLTDRDKNAAACAYGPASGFSLGSATCGALPLPPVPNDAAIVKSFSDQRVAQGAVREYPPFATQPGSLVRVSMRPRGARAGDPDLYVRLGGRPAIKPPAFACRPFLTGALETCELDAGPAPNNLVHLLVHGYTDGSYDLDVSFVPLTP